MLGSSGTYANKKRKKPVLKQKRAPEGNGVVKSNPSKRHRDRLNVELDRLTELLPFPEEVRSCLDKLSVLRLSVGYLRVKSYFKANMKKSKSSLMFPGVNGQVWNGIDSTGFSEGDLLLQALNGFVMVVTSDGLVFYASPTIKDYLGFQQSDVVHQSVFELIHTDDRVTFRQQLHFAMDPSDTVLQSCGNTMISNPEQLPPENSSFLERSFVCRFRCLLDNSSGFLALMFKGRLKYLHGQRVQKDNGECVHPQLALFAIGMPVQPPSIVEIRSKMLLFQSKHKLDFTPLGIDNRGKIILGYSEVELCMKGSGYQFIHAADMMYCAESHIRMIKTGESGLTVFRLLSKSSGWLWVKSNAKLIYKGGRPEFIIANQRPIATAEGEEYLRQRRLQLPFSFTTGEAMLYDTGPTVDITNSQFDKMFSKSDTDMKKDMNPRSLLDCFLSQDKMAYTQSVDAPLPVDKVFMDSGALVSIRTDGWQENAATTCNPVVVKEEAKQSVMAMIDGLGQIAQNGDFRAALQYLEVEDAELMEWQNSLKKSSQQDDKENSVRTELDSILTNEIFDYIESALFKEKEEDCLSASLPSCLTAVNNNRQDPFTQGAQPSATGQQMFQTQSPNHFFSQKNGLYNHEQVRMTAQMNMAQHIPAQMFNNTQKLSHSDPPTTQADTSLPSLQQLQLQDIYSPSIELPELTVHGTSTDDAKVPFQGCGQASITNTGCPQGIPEQMWSSQLPLHPQNNMQAPGLAVHGQLLQTSVQQLNNVAPDAMDMMPPLIACSDFISSNTPNIPIPFPTACLQGGASFETNNHQLQQCLPHAGTMQNGHEPMPAHHSQTSKSQTFPHAGLWPRSVNRLNNTQQSGLACGQATTHSSCMFNKHFSSNPAGGETPVLSESSCPSGADISLDQCPPHGSRCCQWGHSEPAVGTSTINQENAIISPMSVLANMASLERTFNF